MRRCGIVAFVRLVMGVAACGTAHAGVVISQVYGGGGNSGATYANDYVELFNAGSAAQNLMGWSVQYASASGTTWQVTPLSGTILPGQYFLVGEASSAMVGNPLPTPDVAGTINMSNSAGKVVLESTTMPDSGVCPMIAVVDLVGYGTANCFEGTGPAPSPPPGNASAVQRSSPCLDSNDNYADFGAVAADPRNSATVGTPCSPPPIGFAVLESPSGAMAAACQPAEYAPVVYGEVYIPGITPSMSAPTGLVAQLGVGPTGSDPATSAGWSWSGANFNPMHMGDGNDEYMQALAIPHASGTFDYAYRFSYLGGAFVYADTGMGSADGYSPAAAGKLGVIGDTLFCDPFDG